MQFIRLSEYIFIIPMALKAAVILITMIATALAAPTSCNSTHPYTLNATGACYNRNSWSMQSAPGYRPPCTTLTRSPSRVKAHALALTLPFLPIRPASPAVPLHPLSPIMTTPIASAWPHAPLTHTRLPISPALPVNFKSFSVSSWNLGRLKYKSLRDYLQSRNLLC